MREKEKGGERGERDRLEAGKKLSSRFQLLVGLALNRLLTQSNRPPSKSDLQVVQRTSSLPFLEGTKHG